MVVGKTESVVLDLMNQFKDRSVSKKYLALVKGILPKKRGEINAPIGRSTHDRKKFTVRQDGKPSVTRYRVLETYHENYSLLEVTLLTGRTHQIRVHFRYLGFPLLGDAVYGSKGTENKTFPVKCCMPGSCPFNIQAQTPKWSLRLRSPLILSPPWKG